MYRLIFLFLISVVLLLTSCTSKNQTDWFQFRGTGAKGIAPESATPPTDFGPDKNVFWKLEIPEGYSSPIIIEDNLILTGVIKEEKKFLVLNINSNDGSVKWQKEVVVESLEKVHPISSPAAATPVSDGEYIYCYFPSFGLLCYDLDGNKVWERPIVYQQNMSGSGTSPVLYENKLILNFDNLFEPRIMFFDKACGDLLWEHEFQKQRIMRSCSWSTPAIWEDQVIIHRLNNIIGMDINTGKTKWLFEVSTTGCATPVIKENVLYVNAYNMREDKSSLGDITDFQPLFKIIDANDDEAFTKDEFIKAFPEGMLVHDRIVESENFLTEFRIRWWHLIRFDRDKNKQVSKNEWNDFMAEMSNYENHGLVAVNLGDTGNITLSNQLWKIKENIPETPSVLVKNGLLYMVKLGGTVTCVNIENGGIVYVKKLGATGAYFSSPLSANGNIFYSSYNGIITVVEEGTDFNIINQVDLNERIGASPVALNDVLFIRTEKHLYAFKKNEM